MISWRELLKEDMKTIGKYLLLIPIPQCAQWKGRDVTIENSVIIPSYTSFEAGLYIDIIFYGYIYTAVLSWFGHTQPFFDFRWYFLMNTVFWVSAMISVILKYRSIYGTSRVGERRFGNTEKIK